MRQRLRSSSTRQLILDSTASQICRLGYGLTSLSVIATNAGVNLGSIYYHFKTKLAVSEEIGRREQAIWATFVDELQERPDRGLVALAGLSILVARRTATDSQARATVILATDPGAKDAGLRPMVPAWLVSIQALLNEALLLGQIDIDDGLDIERLPSLLLGWFLGEITVRDLISHDPTADARANAVQITRDLLRAGGFHSYQWYLDSATALVDGFCVRSSY